MTPRQLQKLDQELRTFVAELIRGMGRPERREAMQSYIYGLLLDGERLLSSLHLTLGKHIRRLIHRRRGRQLDERGFDERERGVERHEWPEHDDEHDREYDVDDGCVELERPAGVCGG